MRFVLDGQLRAFLFTKRSIKEGERLCYNYSQSLLYTVYMYLCPAFEYMEHARAILSFSDPVLFCFNPPFPRKLHHNHLVQMDRIALTQQVTSGDSRHIEGVISIIVS